MAIRLYMDQHVPRAITAGLRERGVDVLTAQEDEASLLDDSALLRRAGELDRILFTHDAHFLSITAALQERNASFRGVIYAHAVRIPIGACVRDLEVIAKAGEPGDLISKVQYLPL